MRINPWELHIRDPDWTEIYQVTRRAYKPVWYYRTLGTKGSTISTESSEMHHLRRDAIQPYFSTVSVAHHLPQVEALVAMMCSRLQAFRGKDQTVNIGDVFRCYTTDVATAFTFHQAFGHLNHPDFEHDSNAALRNFSPLGLLNRQLRGYLFALIKSVPSWIAKRSMSSASLGLRNFYSVGVILSDETCCAVRFCERKHTLCIRCCSIEPLQNLYWMTRLHILCANVKPDHQVHG